VGKADLLLFVTLFPGWIFIYTIATVIQQVQNPPPNSPNIILNRVVGHFRHLYILSEENWLFASDVEGVENSFPSGDTQDFRTRTRDYARPDIEILF
jgi:hypothetical protein